MWLQKFLQSPALVNTDGVLSGHTDIANQAGKVAASGQMTVDKPKLHGIEMGYPMTWKRLRGDARHHDDLLSISKCAIKLGPTPVFVWHAVTASRRLRSWR